MTDTCSRIMASISSYMNSFQHLKDNKMTYGQHFCRAIGISFTLGLASAKNLLHAFVPDVWTTGASDSVAHLSATVFSADHMRIPPSSTEAIELEEVVVEQVPTESKKLL